MSFVCSDSCKIGITKEKVLAKSSGKLSFSEYRGFQSDALEFSMCQMLGQTCGTEMMELKKILKSGGCPVEMQNFKTGFERMCMPAAWTRREFSFFRICVPVLI